MKNSFSACHPVINFIYFAVVILCSMFFMHPVFLIISLLCGIAYSIMLNGKKAVRFNFLGMLPMMLIVAIINPLFNHQGATVLVYVNEQPITKESVLYGAAAAIMFAAVIIWFSCYNAVMTSDKFVYLFGRVIPSLSLILSMIFRLVPKFKAQTKEIDNAQKCIGKDLHSGNMIQRAKNGITILSILMTWVLENSIDTADSMKSRGHGLKGRSNFSIYCFTNRDKFILGFIMILCAVLFAGISTGECSVQYFPWIAMKKMTLFSIVIYTSYIVLCLLPGSLEIMEAVKWQRLKSKI